MHNRKLFRLWASVTVCLLLCICFVPCTATQSTDSAVAAVITQLEAIDSLQTMQNNRKNYSAAAEYDAYIQNMFAARLAAQAAYDALSASQQAQIDSSLTAKLTDTLSTVFNAVTVPVTPRYDEYCYEVIFKNNLIYEMGHHISAEMPCTILLVDSTETGTSWTPDGLYSYGQNNYEVTYCCDSVYPVKAGTHYRRLNLEDSNYYGDGAAERVRAIILNSYPYLTLDEMKNAMIANGLDASFVASLTRGDIISAVQFAVWTYSNAELSGVNEYVATTEMTNNHVFRDLVHDYTNELWSWWNANSSKNNIYDAQAAYRVNTLVYYLCNLPAVAAQADQIVISDVQITRAELIAETDGLYDVGLYVHLNVGADADDNLRLTVTSTSSAGTVTDSRSWTLGEAAKYGVSILSQTGDTVSVTVEGTQNLGRGVYFYEPDGGREVSQCLVGVAEGETPVSIMRSFTLTQDIEKGLRIYKTDKETGAPLSEITFHIYAVNPAAGETVNPTPTQEEIDRYAVPENLVGSVVTDETGYANLALEDGRYLIVEEYNAEKIKEPVAPFYILVPMPQETESELSDGTETEIVYSDVVSVYPKNETVEPSEDPPEPPTPPDNVTGSFSILKYDENDEGMLLEGAQFAVYRPATQEDTDTVIITCGGIGYSVVPVLTDGVQLVLTTDASGTAYSPTLPCGSYFVKEIKPPTGYKLPNDASTVTVTASVMGTVEQVRISNERGGILPETGGMGTTPLYLLGGVLVLTATLLLLPKKGRRYRKTER